MQRWYRAIRLTDDPFSMFCFNLRVPCVMRDAILRWRLVNGDTKALIVVYGLPFVGMFLYLGLDSGFATAARFMFITLPFLLGLLVFCALLFYLVGIPVIGVPLYVLARLWQLWTRARWAARRVRRSVSDGQ